MKRFLVCAVALLLIIGCRNEEEEVLETTPPPAPSVAKPKPTPPPASTSTATRPKQPGTIKQTSRPSQIKPQARTEGLPELVQQYQSLGGRTQDRAQMIADVGAMATTGTNPADVTKALTDIYRMETDMSLKVEIISELSLLEHPSALEPLLAYSGPNNPAEIQEAAVDGADTLLSDLAFTEDPAMLEPLIKATGSQYPAAVRESAINALEELDDDRALPALQNLVNDPNPDISDAAKNAVEWLQD